MLLAAAFTGRDKLCRRTSLHLAQCSLHQCAIQSRRVAAMTSRQSLIAEVKKYSNLYDTGHERHKDVEHRDKCWIEIAERMGHDCEALKREWKILRDSYRQVIKRRQKNVDGKKWIFEDQMAFLQPFMTDRASSGGRMRLDTSKPVDAESDVESEQIKPLEAVDVDKPDFCWDNSPSSNNTQVDPLELFFSSVCQSTKRLPKPLQNRVKRDVLDAVMRAEEEHETSLLQDNRVNALGNL